MNITLRELINILIGRNNLAAPDDVLVEKLEDIDEIKKAKEELIKIIEEL